MGSHDLPDISSYVLGTYKSIAHVHVITISYVPTHYRWQRWTAFDLLNYKTLHRKKIKLGKIACVRDVCMCALCVCVCVFVCVPACVCVYVCACMQVGWWVHVCMHACMWVGGWVDVCMCEVCICPLGFI